LFLAFRAGSRLFYLRTRGIFLMTKLTNAHLVRLLLGAGQLRSVNGISDDLFQFQV
jgi:hypothetical protein